MEDSNPKVSQASLVPQADEDSPLNMLDKCVAANMLQELGEKLQLLATYETSFPQGLVNVLTCSWRELSKGADYRKWHQKSLEYKNVRSRRSQASEEVKSGTLGSKSTEREMTAIRKERYKKNFALPACTTKEKRKPETASNMPLGSKAPVVQNYAGQSPVTISFSLSSSVCEEGGWIFQLSDSNSKNIHQKLPYVWTPERLEQIQKPMEEQTSKLKEVRFDKPIILRHYGDHRKETFCKTWKVQTGMTVTPKLTYGKPQIPVVKKAGTAQRKLHYGLNDGSSFIYYPSKCLAVCQSCCSLPCGGFYTNIFSPSPDHSIVGTFTPFGHGSICLPSSNMARVMFNQEGGLVTNKDEEMVREWKWPRYGKLAQPVIAQVNEYITVRIAGRFAISLVYKWQHESVCLSLSPLQGAALPQLEELPKLTELLMKNEVPQATVSHMNDISAARELRNLQRKIRSIVDDWLRYYRTALGISHIRLQKMSDLPLRLFRKGIIQSADALPVTSCFQRSQRKRKGNSQAPKSEASLLDQMQLASPYNMQQEPYSCPLRDKLQVISQAACPAVLRAIMMGKEGKMCRCSNHQIPCVSDLEYDHLINNQMSFKEQIIVICVTSSSQTSTDPSEDKIEQLYERKNKNRSMPCAQGYLDSFRLLKYNINSADAFTDHKGSLLEKRHNVAPGMFLRGHVVTDGRQQLQISVHSSRFSVYPKQQQRINQANGNRKGYIPLTAMVIAGGSRLVYIHLEMMYMQGKLLFANYIFNGYSKSTKDLQKQIVKTRSDYRMGYCLPSDFKFRNGPLFNSTK